MTQPDARVPEDASGTAVEGLLQELAGGARAEASRHEAEAKRWRKRGFWLSLLAAVGSGFAAGAVAVGDLGNDVVRGAIVVAAILGAGLSGIAAAVGAPQQADKSDRDARSLEALARWAELERVRRATSGGRAEERIVAFYSWHDAINGVEVPLEVREEVKRT